MSQASNRSLTRLTGALLAGWRNFETQKVTSVFMSRVNIP